MKYSIREVTLDKDHWNEPGRNVFRVYDKRRMEYLMSYYTTREAAEWALERRKNR